MRSLRVRTGDEIKVMRGQFSGKMGKVESVDVIRTRVFVIGIDLLKRDGSKKQYPLSPSNLLITKVADDKRRFVKADETSAPKKVRAPKAAAKKTTESKQEQKVAA